MEYLEHEEEEEDQPVSPTGQYFNSSVLQISIMSILELDIPIDDLPTLSLLKDVFLPINPRFSSLMVCTLFSFSFSFQYHSQVWKCFWLENVCLVRGIE